MVEYRIVKYCRFCKKRFVVDKSESQKHFCDKCQKVFNKNKDKLEELK